MKARLQSLPYGLRLLLATLSLGIGTGLVGIACHYLLESVQWLAFGQASSDLLQQFQEAGGLRRFLVLCVTGCLAAGFWYVLQRRYKLQSIRKQIDLVGNTDPVPLPHLLHAVMQIVIVGAGASVGKEAAPREVGALIGGRLAKAFFLTVKERKVLIACGAGAGLAAVYQVPFASSLFVFETLGLAYSWQNILLVLASTYLANWIVQPIVGHDVLYHLSAVSWSLSSFLQAMLIALLVTPLALVFRSLAKQANRKRCKDETILWALPLVFLVLGSLVSFFPIFMGNGQVLAQALLSRQPVPYLPLALAMKGLLVYLLLHNGAYGGTLTPSFALGIGAGYLVTLLLTVVGVHLDPALGMLLGATVFLGTTLQAPLTAIALSLGFAGQDWSLTIPLVLAAGMSYVIRKRWEKKQ
ncbi:putative voltage-gated ClC-type chloride channel ClcB [Streptococcus oralis]|uniref:Putative voltage-gated ClC-type chloride channel ClcB n=1 Tax=Streptococcus oralis TaxID=1303 RepID=A0A428I891_STROR|nr:chloride channel protein [Streptococcus oralis]RSK08881.1 putative voltage-gated ClC-type chloride channel ClcB [Streptococcus oralis]